MKIHMPVLTAAAALVAGLGTALQVQAQEAFASEVTNMFRGEAPGSQPGEWYGGSLTGSFPVVFTPAQAQTAVLGAADGIFTTLPGVGPQEPGTAFRGAYIEVGFGRNFGAETVLTVYEAIRSDEEASIWVWFLDGGFLQLSTEGRAGDAVQFDLRSYADVLASHGGAFTRVGIGGVDVGGSSQGFDLDAVSITPIPEPETYALMLAGLGAVAARGWIKRARSKEA
ncbi:MAG TPA: PEP-CTERM sorting domain-containing protein [Burkholderiaceae bacterium]|nr:PEP-CTERM sorting domain-containing protein [Burkholderiaceae bacterium]